MASMLLVLPAPTARAQQSDTIVQLTCTLPRVDALTEVVAGMFLDPPGEGGTDIIRIGRMRDPAALILTSALPRTIQLEVSRQARLRGIFINGPEGTQLTGVPSDVPVLRHIAGSPVPACAEKDLPNLAVADARQANLDTQRISLALFRRAPERTLTAVPGRALELGDVINLGTEVGAIENELLRQLSAPQTRQALDRFLALRSGLDVPVPPPSEACALPAGIPFSAHVSFIAVGRGENYPLNALPDDGLGTRQREQERRVDIHVTATDTPSVLILNAYHPTEWLIGRAEGAEVAAIVLTGFGRQRITGLPAATPVLRHTAAQMNQNCWDAGLEPRVVLNAERDQPAIDAIVRTLIGKAPDRVVVAETAGTLTTTGAEPLDIWAVQYSGERGGVYERDLIPPGFPGLLYLFQRRLVEMASADKVVQWYSVAYPETETGGRLAVPEHSLEAGSAVLVKSRLRNLPRGIRLEDATYLFDVGLERPPEEGWEETEVYLSGGECLDGRRGGQPCRVR